MIGIVIVSHSRKLADGLKEMADAMSQASVPIASAGGLDDPESPLGTDAVRVRDGVRQVMSDKGVVIFADIGSAKLSAEMAIDLLDEAERDRVRFCDAPLVEGVLAAAVQSAAGGDMAAVLQEAQGGFSVAQSGDDGVSRDYVIRNRLGLHARPAAVFVQAMNAFSCDIRLTNLTKGKPPANAKSINGVMLSEVSGNDRVRITAQPLEADAVFAEMDRLLASNFGEAETAPAARAPEVEPSEVAQGKLKGVSIAPGFVVGPLRHVCRDLPDVEALPITDTGKEVARFDKALAQSEVEIEALIANTAAHISDYDKKIFQAHIAYLRDPDIRVQVEDWIRTRQICAAAIWRQVMGNLHQTYASLGDPVLAARAADIVDVARRVLHQLTGEQDDSGFDEPAVLAYEELAPSDVLVLAGSQVLGICAASGGKTSHAGILASSLPVPVVFALGQGVRAVCDGVQVVLDGAAAELNVSPSREEIAAVQVKRGAWQKRRAQAEQVRFDPAITADGHKVRVAANMASLEELGLIANSGAEEVGLLRTEFLFMRRDAAPTEAEQYQIYKAMVDGLDGRPLTIRTIDIGSDKPVHYLDRPSEVNPNLGWRGLRYSLDAPELFETQLAAILRASAHGPVRIMFPLVSTLDEVRAAKAHLDRVKDRLRLGGHAFDDQIETGIMIEVPAAAEMAGVLAPHVDFFSIGTNDLTQYVMASDRANPKLQTLFDPFNPAVLRMIAKSIKAAHSEGIWIGMCGAMAGSPLAAPVLVGMGLDEFSMTPADIAEFKLTLIGLDRSACRGLAKEVVNMSSAVEVRSKITELFGETNGKDIECSKISL